MKPDLKTLWKTKKKWIIGITAGVAAAAVGCGFWYQAGHSSKDPVYVYPFQYIGMTEYWGDSQDPDGHGNSGAGRGSGEKGRSSDVL